MEAISLDSCVFSPVQHVYSTYTARVQQRMSSSTNKIKDTLRKQAVKIRSRWRKVVTGNEEKRIRDLLREAEEQPKYFKLLDKVAFTLGVLNIVACQYFLLNIPTYFPIWYTFIIPVLLLSRFYHFRSMNWQYFMFDFCYFGITCSLINLLFLRKSALFFKICFIFTTGSLPIAIPVWRNSFIFHDFDKIVSVYIHILPCMLYYTLRWHGEEVTNNSNDSARMCLGHECSPLYVTDYLFAILLYAAWQVAYIVKTEVWDKEKFDTNPNLLTSLRWLSKDTKNPTARGILKVMRQVGIFQANEDYDSTSMKTKLVFVGSQFLLTLVSFIPTPFIYYSSKGMLTYIGILFTIAVYNGASFYIEVFSQRYHLHIAKLEEMNKIAREAKQIAHQINQLDDDNTVVKKLPTPKRSSGKSNTDSFFSDSTSDEKESNKGGSGAKHHPPPSLSELSHSLLRTSQEAKREMKSQSASFKYYGDSQESGNSPFVENAHLDDSSPWLESEEGGGSQPTEASDQDLKHEAEEAATELEASIDMPVDVYEGKALDVDK